MKQIVDETVSGIPIVFSLIYFAIAILVKINVK